MPAQKRNKTMYPGVFFIEGKQAGTGKPELIYLIRYRKDGKLVEEKAGRQFQNDMTPARAASLRALRMADREPTNKERRVSAQQAKEAEANRWTIEKLWAEYKKVNSIKGLVTDQNRFDNYIAPAFGKKEPREITPLDFDRLRIRLLKTRTPATTKNVLELLRRVINFGAKKNLCPAPGFTIKMPAVNNLKTEDLTPEQLKKLLAVLDEAKNQTAANVMKMALYTGMRRGELFKLTWDAVDFRRGIIHIRDPKGGQNETIPLNDMARIVLEAQQEILAERLKSKRVKKKQNGPYVFPGRGGELRTDIKKAISSIKKLAGLPDDFRALHGLRHVYASLLASSGKVDLYTIQKLLTHKSGAMTQRYAHLRDETLKQAANVAGAMIGSAIKETASNVVEIGKPTA